MLYIYLLLQIDLDGRFNLKPVFFLSINYHFMGLSFPMIDNKFSKWLVPSFSKNYDIIRTEISKLPVFP